MRVVRKRASAASRNRRVDLGLRAGCTRSAPPDQSGRDRYLMIRRVILHRGVRGCVPGVRPLRDVQSWPSSRSSGSGAPPVSSASRFWRLPCVAGLRGSAPGDTHSPCCSPAADLLLDEQLQRLGRRDVHARHVHEARTSRGDPASRDGISCQFSPSGWEAVADMSYTRSSIIRPARSRDDPPAPAEMFPADQNHEPA